MQKCLNGLRVDMHAAQPSNRRSTRAKQIGQFNGRQR